MTEFEQLEFLDNLLSQIKNSASTPIYSNLFSELFGPNYTIDFSIYQSAIKKLINDNYLYSVDGNMVDTGQPIQLLHLTFEGIFFINSGGYVAQRDKNHKAENERDLIAIEQRRQAKQIVFLNRWIVFGAVVVAIDSILNILHFFGVYYDTTNHIFCIKPT